MNVSKSPVGLIVVLGSAAFIYIASFTYSVGHAIDDGIHIVTAKSMATGQGLRLISDPESPVSTQFPPGLSLLLVPVLWLFPDIPDNIIPMKMVPAMSALLYVMLSWFWLRRYCSTTTSLWLTALVAINPETVRFSGAVIAEMGYAASSMLALLMFERYDTGRDNLESRRYLILTVVAITGAYLFRSVGLSLVLSAAGLLLLRRRWTAAAAVGIGFLVCASPWLLKGALVGTPEYQEQFWLFDLEDPEQGAIGLFGLVDRALINGPTYFITTIPYHLFPPLGGQRIVQVFQNMGFYPVLVALQVCISFTVCIGFWRRIYNRTGFVDLYTVIYFGVLLFWHTRLQWKYLAPITPILLLYMTEGVRWVITQIPRLQLKSERLSAPLFIFLIAGCGIRSMDYFERGWLLSGKVDPYRNAYGWIRDETPPESRLMGFDHLGLYLYTGRKAIATAMSHFPRNSMHYIQTTKTDYFIVGTTVVKGGSTLEEQYVEPIFEKYPDSFSLMYMDPESRIRVYKVHPMPLSDL